MKGDFNIKMTKLKVLELEMIRKLDGDDDTSPSKENDIGLNINDFSELWKINKIQYIDLYSFDIKL